MEVMRNLQNRIDRLPRIRLVHLPTPLEELRRLSKAVGGPRLWIKRDDCTGLAFGGNKERKVEFVMADAVQKGADVVITIGDVQSNHARATAAAARKLGLKAVLFLRRGERKEYDGNLLLDHLLGADIIFIHRKSWRNIESIMNETMKELKEKGHVPYLIPSGASYPVGAVAYVNAALELYVQAAERGLNFDYVIHAAGSGGTQAGLVLGNKALKSEIEVLGVCVEPNDGWLTEKTVKIANGTAKLLGLDMIVEKSDVTLVDEYVGEGYGVLTKEVGDAIKLVAQTEGIFLDPVYTGKAMAGLLDMIKHGRFNKNDNIVFVHTGGTPVLFTYRKGLGI
jgi:L-cysteate sulfo-lyase